MLVTPVTFHFALICGVIAAVIWLALAPFTMRRQPAPDLAQVQQRQRAEWERERVAKEKYAAERREARLAEARVKYPRLMAYRDQHPDHAALVDRVLTEHELRVVMKEIGVDL